jgi:AraC family transcriptional regulator of adaptative response / DNA-3-methyladenine glycosylase II
MELDADLCYRALVARDPRFDGVFFVGVTTTRIYCRPVCTARTPGFDRCRFFPSAAAAERERFRPCLRCRPELAPGHAPVDATGRLARAAAARIAAGALNDGAGIDELAADLHVGARQLRRAVGKELGVSPVELAQTHRLLLAKQLLTETRLPVIRVAFASGFSSVRRFNALFRAHYRLTPTRLRRIRGRLLSGEAVCLRLSYRPPLAWTELLDFLAARAIPGVECVADGTYARTVALGKYQGWLRVSPVPGRNVLTVEVADALVPVLPLVLARVRSLFDLDARPDVIASHLDRDPLLGDWVRACPGLRVPGAFSGFELAVRAILGQQVSIRAASTLAGRLACALGQPLTAPWPCLSRGSPTPESLAHAKQTALTALGLTSRRAEAIQALAHAVLAGEVQLEPTATPVAAIEALRGLPGVGDWTAQYIALRALRWPDAFPHADLGLRKGTGWLEPAQFRLTAEAWRPWRAYAAMHIWNANHET